jgi:hypothetical protein
MSLNRFARGFPEQTIEQAIASIPFFIRQCRSDEARRAFHYQNPEDFVLGVTIGSIVTSFETAFKIANGRHFNQNEISEINKVINAKMPRICSALFGTR